MVWGMTQTISAPTAPTAADTVNRGVEDFRPSLVDGDRLAGDVAVSLLSLKVVGGPDIADQGPVDARRNVDRQGYLAGSGGAASLPVAAVEHRVIAGVRVRIYTPEGAGDGPAPVLIYLHGGGWVTGSLDSHDSTCRYFCNRAAVRVISVDYRMAPEFPFPAPLEDVTAVVTAALDGDIPEVDPDHVIVAGDSAGGHLTTAASLWLKQQGRRQPALQMLFAPVVDQRDVDEVMAAHPAAENSPPAPTSPRRTSAGTTGTSSVTRTPPDASTSWSRRCSPTTCRASPRPMSPSPGTTRCATRGRSTRAAWRRPGSL
jgi:acetyl esterase/lipase